MDLAEVADGMVKAVPHRAVWYVKRRNYARRFAREELMARHGGAVMRLGCGASSPVTVEKGWVSEQRMFLRLRRVCKMILLVPREDSRRGRVKWDR